MRVFPKAIVLTTTSHFVVKKAYASIRGLVVRTIALGKTRISADFFLCSLLHEVTVVILKCDFDYQFVGVPEMISLFVHGLGTLFRIIIIVSNLTNLQLHDLDYTCTHIVFRIIKINYSKHQKRIDF